MSLLNSTTSSGFYELYRGTDFSSLNWLEQQWAFWYIRFGNPVIATGLMAFIVHEVSFHNLDVTLSTSSFCFFNRLFTSVVVFRGLSSTQCHTSGDGSCNLTRCLRRKNSGLAHCRSCSHILLLNCRWYVTWLAKFSRNWKVFFFLIVDHAFPSRCWNSWNEHLPGPLPVVEVNAPPNILFLRFWGLLPFPR